VTLWEAQGPWKLTGPTRNVLCAGTTITADGPLAPHAAFHAASNALIERETPRNDLVSTAVRRPLPPAPPPAVGRTKKKMNRTHTYLGVVRAAVASRAVGHDVKHELPASVAGSAAREEAGDGEHNARADYAGGALQDRFISVSPA
jgi:hypothetical protein